MRSVKPTSVPFLDLRAQYLSIEQELRLAIESVIGDCAFAGGPYAEQFERAFARYCRRRHAIAVGSGTDALWLALAGLGVGAGDEVITAPNSFIATAEAISMTGAQPVFADVDPTTCTLDPQLVERAITPRTRAIVPVHLYGQTADMTSIGAIAERHGLLVVEDACQAHGARHGRRPAGAFGDAGCFSFYPGKNLGAYGEAGAIVTSDQELARTIRALRDHGQEQKHDHRLVGWNARMDGLQAAVLTTKLRHLEQWTERRRAIAARYDELLADNPELVTPVQAPGNRHVYHLYVVRAGDRQAVTDALSRAGIAYGIHYPQPIHLQPAYRHLELSRGAFPVAEQLSEQIVSLPMYPELSDGQVERVAAALGEVTRRRVVA